MSEAPDRRTGYRDALYDSLAGDTTAARDADPLAILNALVQRCRALVANEPQAADLSGLALVIDDELMIFLRDLLEVDSAETEILDRLRRAFPEITQANLDQAVAEFRAILEYELPRSGGRLRLLPEDGA